jgi:hypothetical protein
VRIEKRKSGLSVLRGSIGVLVLAAVAGAGYVWWNGQQSHNQAVLSEQTQRANLHAQVNTAEKPAKDPISVSVESITSPVPQESNVTLEIKTLSQAECTIEVIYNGAPSNDPGLSPKTADTSGSISWTWMVEETVPVGTWPAEVECSRDGESATARAEVDVTPPPAH